MKFIKELPDLTGGKMTPTIFRYCIPIILGNLLQVLFNTADQMVLGQMAGSVAVASAGACSMAVILFTQFLNGCMSGTTVILARLFGVKDYENAKIAIGTSILGSFGLGVLMTVLALPFVKPLLTLTGCPAECFDGACIYLTVYYVGIPAIALYNSAASILRVSGDSKRPTLYLTYAGIMNLLLNVFFCLILKQKVAGVALATVISQAFGAFLTVRRLFTSEDGYRLRLRETVFDRRVFGKVLRYGLPLGINYCAVSIAGLQIQTAVNSFGVSATAGNSAAAGINSLTGALHSGFSGTVLAMVGQNLGCGNEKRAKEAVRMNLFWGVLCSVCLGSIILLFGRQLLWLYVPGDETAISLGLVRLFYEMPLLGVSISLHIFGSALNAYGYSFFNMASGLTAELVFRTVWFQFVFPQYNTFEAVQLCTVFSAFLCLILRLGGYLIITRKKRAKPIATL